MKKDKPKRRTRSPSLPEFVRFDRTEEKKFNDDLRLARYGRKAQNSLLAVELVEAIRRWREQLPEAVRQLRASRTYGEQTAQVVASAEKNTEARVAWCKYFEDAIMAPDIRFFEAIIAVLKYSADGSEAAHPVEYHTLLECARLRRKSGRPSDDGKWNLVVWPTKGQLRKAVESKGITITKWSLVLKRLHLDDLPTEKSGPRKRGVR